MAAMPTSTAKLPRRSSPKPRISFPNRRMLPSRRSSPRNPRGPDPAPAAFGLRRLTAFQHTPTFPIDYSGTIFPNSSGFYRNAAQEPSFYSRADAAIAGSANGYGFI